MTKVRNNDGIVIQYQIIIVVLRLDYLFVNYQTELSNYGGIKMVKNNLVVYVTFSGFTCSRKCFGYFVSMMLF